MLGCAVLLCIIASVVALRQVAAAPDRDRELAYPEAPERWLGGQAVAPSLRERLRAPLYWQLAVAVAVVPLALWPAWAPLVLLGAALGVLLGLGLAPRAWLASPLRLSPRAVREPSLLEPGSLPVLARLRVLCVVGSVNQCTQLHQVVQALGEVDAYFTPAFSDGLAFRLTRALGLQEVAITGYRRRARAFRYLAEQGLAVDLHGELHRGHYDLVLLCTDLVLPSWLRGATRPPTVLVQEGIHDPPSCMATLRQWVPGLPRWLEGTAALGQSDAYDALCVASPGYADFFASRGVARHKLFATGIPNFDDCAAYARQPGPAAGYLLVCTSDARETCMPGDRGRLLERVAALRRGRALHFKLHPNERLPRAHDEIRARFPDAVIHVDGSAERLVAHADEVVCEWSSLAFVALALGKPCHSYRDLDSLKTLLPLQHGRAAQEIAALCCLKLKAAGRRSLPPALASSASACSISAG